MNKKNDELDFESEEVVLLITGCISPNPEQRFLLLKDSEVRLKQYLESIEFYIKESMFYNIVFCENSEYVYDGKERLVDLARGYSKNFEWITFYGNQKKLIECGKGYGEGEIIKYALDNSVLLSKADSFVKITGRLTILNLEDVLSGAKKKCNYFNRDIYTGHGIDTRFYLCDKEYYKEYLLFAYQKTDVNKASIEWIFYNILERKKYRSLMAYPDFRGKSGGNGRDYSKMPRVWINIYSFFCKINLLNEWFAIVLVFKKLRAIYNERIRYGRRKNT